MDIFILVLEMIGTVAFAVSGAMTGLKKKMDIFGVAILGLTTAVGGGVIRDIILGITPPRTFQNPIYALVAIGTALIIFIPVIHRWMLRRRRLYENVLSLMDALGLGIFTVTGISVANSAYIGFSVPGHYTGFLLVFVGVVTGVGGGILRDMLAGDTPYIFVKHIYAVASIFGAVACAVLWNYTDKVYAMLAGMILIVAIRLLSARFKWNLPRAKGIDDLVSHTESSLHK